MGKAVVRVSLGIVGFLALILVLVLLGAWLMTIVWSWVVPDVFSGAVGQGVLPASLSMVQAMKLSILLSILGLTGIATRMIRRK